MRVVLTVVALSVLAAGTARSAVLDPFNFPSSGSLDLTSGSYTLDVHGDAGGFPVLSGPLGVIATGTQYTSIASNHRKVGILDFDSVHIGLGATISVIGTDPVGILSRSSIVLEGSVIDLGGDFIVGTPSFTVLGQSDAPAETVSEPLGWVCFSFGLFTIVFSRFVSGSFNVFRTIARQSARAHHRLSHPFVSWTTLNVDS